MDMAVQHSVQQISSMQAQAAKIPTEQVSPQDTAAFAAMTASPAQESTAAAGQNADMRALSPAQDSAAPPLSSAASADPAMEANITVRVTPPNASSASAVNPVESASPPDSAALSPGAKILQKLERLSTDMNAGQVQLLEQAGDSAAGRMCKLQFEVAQFSTNQAILGQTGSKSSQGVQTLLKGQ